MLIYFVLFKNKTEENLNVIFFYFENISTLVTFSCYSFHRGEHRLWHRGYPLPLTKREMLQWAKNYGNGTVGAAHPGRKVFILFFPSAPYAYRPALYNPTVNCFPVSALRAMNKAKINNLSKIKRT